MRFYPTNTAPATAVPDPAAGVWVGTGSSRAPERLTPVRSSANPQPASVPYTYTTPGAELFLRLISDPGDLPAGHYTGSLSVAYITQTNVFGPVTILTGLQAHARIVAADGTTVRRVLGTILAPALGGNRATYGTLDVGRFTLETGDRLLVEVGGRVTGFPPGEAWVNLPGQGQPGDAPDLPTASGALNPAGVPWIDLDLTPDTRDLTATATPTSIALAWDDGPVWADGTVTPDGYAVQLDAGPWVDVPGIGSHTLTGLVPSTTYDVGVRGWWIEGASGPGVETLLLDTFDRPDGGYQAGLGVASDGHPWTGDTNGVAIRSNRVAFINGPLDGPFAAALVDVGATTYVIEVDQPTAPAVNERSGLVVRWVDNANQFWIYCGDGHYSIVKATAGSYSFPLVTSVVPAAGDHLKVTVEAAAITLEVNGVTLGTVADASYNTGTRVGFNTQNATPATYDNLHVYRATAPTPEHRVEGDPSYLEVTTPAPVVGEVDRRWWTHRLAAAVGLDPVADQPVVQVLTWSGDGWVLDPDLSNALVNYAVTYGRRDTGSRPDVVTASLTLGSARVPVTPPIATRIRVQLSPVVCAAMGLPPAAGVRFTGEVTDPTVDHDGRLTGLVCAGRLGRANRIPLDGTGWPVEDDGERVARILTSNPIDLEVGTLDPGASGALAAPTRLETTAALLEQVAASSLGFLIEQPTGQVDWHDAEHRRGAVPAVTLSAAAVLRRVTWTQRLSSLVNDLDVKTSAGAVVTVEDTESSDPTRYGPWPGTLDTILTNPLDARAVGVDVVARRADPSWQLPDLTANLIRTVPLADLPAVLALRFGDLLELGDLPADFPVPGGRLFVEGYVETATPRSWSLSVSVSDPLQSGAGIRWIDFPDTDAYQWDDLDADLSWFDVARITDPADTL